MNSEDKLNELNIKLVQLNYKYELLKKLFGEELINEEQYIEAFSKKVNELKLCIDVLRDDIINIRHDIKAELKNEILYEVDTKYLILGYIVSLNIVTTSFFLYFY